MNLIVIILIVTLVVNVILIAIKRVIETVIVIVILWFGCVQSDFILLILILDTTIHNVSAIKVVCHVSGFKLKVWA